MPVSIFNFGIKKMTWKSKLLAYLTVLFNFLLFFSYLSYIADPIAAIWVSFLGLGYPIILLINFILLVIWFFKKKLFFLTSLLVMIAGMYHHSRFIQISPKIFKSKSEREANFSTRRSRLESGNRSIPKIK